MLQTRLALTGLWTEAKDGDEAGLALFLRHYSSEKRRRRGVESKLFVGPGEKLVLVSPQGDALFAWQRQKERLDGQVGACCTVFRNEGSELSSELILEAEEWAWEKWPGERLFTFVDGEKTRSRRGRLHDPGWCFIMAAWRACGRSKDRGLVILEKQPGG
jgi:hypothetical protein